VSTDPRDNRGYEIIQEVVAQAMADDEYRQQLIDDPKAVLQDAGLIVSDEVEIEIHQNQPDRVHFVLPAVAVEEVELDIDEVEIVAISHHWPI
jgi:hypothetical protein